MKTLLLLGGMTPDVTAVYYKAINAVVRTELGARHSAPLYLYSADFEAMLQHFQSGDLDGFAKAYTDPIASLADRVDAVVVCAIIAHKVTTQLRAALEPHGIPLLHIADELSLYLKRSYPHVRKLGLLGPKATMTGGNDPSFFVAPLEKHGFQVLIPATEADLDELNRGMFEELVRGAAAVTPKTRQMFVDQAKSLVARGAEAIVLGSTDLGFVIEQKDLGDVPLLETASIHAEQAALWALGRRE